MKKSTIIFTILFIILFGICIFQQIEMFAIAREINRINDFLDSQIKINENLIEAMKYLIG